MTHRRAIYVSAVLVAAVAVSFLGCGSKKKKGDKSFKVFPKESDVLLGVNGASARKGRTYKRLANGLPPSLKALMTAWKSCGIDILERVDTAVIAASTKTRTAVASVKGFSRSDFKQCGEVAKEFTIENEGDVTSVTVRGETNHIAWLDETTFLGAPLAPKSDLRRYAGGGGGLDGNTHLMSIADSVDRTAPIWFAYAPEGGKLEVPMIGVIKGVWGTIATANGLSIEVYVKLPSSGEAASLVKTAKKLIPQFEEDAGELYKYLERLQVGSSGNKVRLELSVSESELTELIRAIEGNEMISEALGGLLPF